MAKTVVVGLSGGVDSSTAAALLLEQGYDVIGVTMRHLPAETTNSCCSLEAIVDARRVAKKLGIPHYLVDVEQPFYERVILPFEEAYLSGMTPNPCALCNRHIKFGAMWEWASKQGADYLATGHYVRLQERDGLYYLMRGIDHAKDQSYLLYTMRQDDLAHLLFPLGEYYKEDSRRIAERYGLVTAHKAESQELCFVPKNDYQGYLESHRPEAVNPGEVVDTKGQVLGHHRGIAFYTIGQRRGLGISSPVPRYVVKLDAKTNQVVVGDKEDVLEKTVHVSRVNYVLPISANQLRGDAKIRYNMEPEPAWWMDRGENAEIIFDQPQWAISPGQVAVLYQNDVLVAGGRIQK
ncbi:tRNA 2-thiouridine(34) synthase MnmA [Sulfobacillus thermosulfidooxidans]|uniref:tRNA-specific 2-thiouridylase MnmA n=1 Tax=Sulfobacillus thermosulfidooxidans (strain DSM 9293 / VKM B-1269 / AT-1) TaxID=929705 RepID=A0A1W1WIV4_SULTA|nr:tRNA 2-thiouridine(34) synthase MnmA [Sulfobacillus thermosulfidooxidans]OLZ08587.1 tRNA 2-thiouridine(34) synthase MnmA [Sulfobacillus thermosulfidooxidans]OLZ13190.1 tRNA 2-thiouridine(34) synthase MnmA [Sulfobacillus thermosulfidooxidans]OLZ21570.1 tRNA 2-thiouridine(34) synthase MnmA [Sulfobacillus thermosulfidooxidans]SMC06079.1 tRNA-specific 2-thiouridylase [Sulfobacillus thermosulfidooxidans DSM 9293]